jgi:hypothetical protein
MTEHTRNFRQARYPEHVNKRSITLRGMFACATQVVSMA